MAGLLLVALAIAGAAACRAAAPAEPYVGLSATREQAAQAVVDAIEARDLAGLERLAVSSAEFRQNIWDALPASRPEVGMPVDYAWAETNLKSRGSLAETLGEFAGRPLVVEAVRFAGRSTRYESFVVHGDTRLVVRDATNTTREVRLFGSMLETPEGWKVFSYVVD